MREAPPVAHVRRLGSSLAVVALGFLLAGAVSPADAAQGRSDLRHCRQVRVETTKAVHITASYRCRSARKDLKALLRQGVASLPARKTALGRWRCRKEGSTRICKQVRRGRPALRILFRTATVRQNSQPPPTGPPPPKPPPPKPAPPQDCLDLWNASGSHAFANDGYHFYWDHGIRQAWVFHMTDGTQRCAVIFVVPSTDPYYYEFGTDGATENSARNGWIPMQSTEAFGGRSVEIQTQATDNANASLSSVGTIAPL
jgi:hypothetical protein